MNREKSIIIIFFAIVLALICSLLIFKPNKPKIQSNESLYENTSQILLKESEKNIEDVGLINNEPVSDGEPVVPKIQSSFSEKKILQEKQNVSEQSKEEIIHEASIIEEVPDYGLIKDEQGNIIITREFGKKSSIKYSFRDFGVIDKVSTK